MIILKIIYVIFLWLCFRWSAWKLRPIGIQYPKIWLFRFNPIRVSRLGSDEAMRKSNSTGVSMCEYCCFSRMTSVEIGTRHHCPVYTFELSLSKDKTRPKHKFSGIYPVGIHKIELVDYFDVNTFSLCT